ncbi:DUF2690 domain-containing protein, partial [Streptomyces minutiscleroticus]|uniref:DUF2690 domain-containing protein n=1 Tax=Streptomyces minutiscleroticus TaxID=68238 RepID=UPI00331815F9
AAVVPEPEPEPEAGRGAPAGDPVAAPVPTQAPAAAGNTRVGHRRTAVVAVLASVCAALLGAVVLTLLLLPHRSGAERPVGTLPASGSGSGSGPFCREAACRGKDPLVMRCAADPDTLVEHRTAGGASVQIRYSDTCGSSWARMWGARIGDRIEVRVDGPDGPVRDARVGNRREADTYVHTLMGVTPPGALVQGCFLPAGRGEKECFEARSVLRHPGMAAPVPGTP